MLGNDVHDIYKTYIEDHHQVPTPQQVAQLLVGSTRNVKKLLICAELQSEFFSASCSSPVSPVYTCRQKAESTMCPNIMKLLILWTRHSVMSCTGRPMTTRKKCQPGIFFLGVHLSDFPLDIWRYQCMIASASDCDVLSIHRNWNSQSTCPSSPVLHLLMDVLQLDRQLNLM